LNGFIKNIKYVLNSGVVRFLIPAKASEIDKLSYKEIKLLVKTTIEFIKYYYQIKIY